MDRFEIYKKLCFAMDRKDYDDVRVLLYQLRDCVYAGMRDMKPN